MGFSTKGGKIAVTDDDNIEISFKNNFNSPLPNSNIHKNKNNNDIIIDNIITITIITTI